MKTYNHHPQLYNQPLRLTQEQKHNPFLVIDDFFESYHLNEVREILWRWMEEVVCSRHNSTDPIERSNDIYFYEKMEELVEAALMLAKRKQKALRKRNRNCPKKAQVVNQ